MEKIERFRRSIQIDTSWPKDAPFGDAAAEAPLRNFQEFLLSSYPTFSKNAEHWILSPYAMIFRWAGSSAEKPILFTAHYDVVPVEEEKWTTDPFGAEQKEGYIYGRGTLDMKSILVSLMEAAEEAAARGFTPKQDIYFAFGGDEERAGIYGAIEMRKWFKDKSIHFSWVFDEGTMVTLKQIAWIDKPLALLSIEEKGFMSVELSVDQAPGHASRPPNEQAVVTLAQALLRVSKAPFPFRLTPTVEAFFNKLGALSSGPIGFFLRHARFFAPLLFAVMGKNSTMASLLHTTLAMTQLEGSKADNVMPSTVKAVFNLRLLDPWTVESAMEYLRKTIKDDRVKIRLSNLSTNPVPANPEHAKGEGPGYRIVKDAINKTFPDVPVLPFLMVATTDSRHYKDISDGIFRFCPQVLPPEELALVHGHDERISIENLHNAQRFYANLIGAL
ncbi:MAG: M20/M25/M40 family metallo-hydrolase [Treponema sp.]|nr:M20/M25/M40 family metallo-hydrolase [Treponema sp.]